MFNLRKENMSNPESIDEIVSADTTEADLEEVLKGLKQEQLDKLTKELSKKAKPEDMTRKWTEAKDKLMRKNRISSLSEQIYNDTRKAPYHFESIEKFNAWDRMCRKRATDEAIRRIVAEKMVETDE